MKKTVVKANNERVARWLWWGWWGKVFLRRDTWAHHRYVACQAQLRKEHPSQNFRADRDVNIAQLPLQFTGMEKRQGIEGTCRSTLRSTRCQVWPWFWILDRRSQRNSLSLENPTWSRQVTLGCSIPRLINSLVRPGLLSHLLFSHSKPSENLKVYQGFAINKRVLTGSQVRRWCGPLYFPLTLE